MLNATNMLRLVSPLFPHLYRKNEYGDLENEPEDLSPQELIPYQEPIRAAIASDRSLSDNPRGLAEYPHDAALQQKLISILPNEAGFSPLCPALYLPLIMNDAIPEEHKDGIDMGRNLLWRSHVLVVCGHTVTEAMKNDIAVAQRLGITATTLEGILTVKGQGRRNHE